MSLAASYVNVALTESTAVPGLSRIVTVKLLPLFTDVDEGVRYRLPVAAKTCCNTSALATNRPVMVTPRNLLAYFIILFMLLASFVPPFVYISNIDKNARILHKRYEKHYP